jgi:hypothetical protein
MQHEDAEPDADPGLTISREKAFYIIVKAREFDEKVVPSDPESGSNPSDDKDVDILEDYRDDPTLEELEGALVALNEDEQLDLLALMWLGREDFASFGEARAEACDMPDKHIPRYLIGTPELGDYLEEGLAQLGISLEEFEINRL